jgi:hypothetical protein
MSPVYKLKPVEPVFSWYGASKVIRKPLSPESSVVEMTWNVGTSRV